MPRVASLLDQQIRTLLLRGWRLPLLGEDLKLVSVSAPTALAIFLIDVSLELGVAVGVLYLAVVWTSSYSRHKEAIWIAAICCCGLIALGWVVSPENSDAWKAGANRGLSLLVVFFTALGLHERRAGDIALRQLAEIVTSTDDAVFGNTLNGTITSWNDAAERLYGYTADEIIGQSISRLAPPDKPDEPVVNLGRVRRGERIVRLETVRMHKDGSPRHVSLTVSPISDARGRIVGVSTIGRDIGDRVAFDAHQQEAMRKIEKLNRDLRQSNADLNRFASVASHDLGAPLRRMRSFAELLRRQCSDKLPEESRGLIDRMLSSVTKMQTMTGALLEFSRIGTGEMKFARVNLTSIAGAVVEDLGVDIDEAGAVIKIEDLPEIDADEHLMYRLFQNLISNGLKFSVDGRVPNVSISAARTGVEDGCCAIEITDNGIGFSKAQARKIFEAFERLHGEDEYDGAGLGLAVCRRVAEAHGGSIVASGRPGAGATFTVVLPLRQPDTGN